MLRPSRRRHFGLSILIGSPGVAGTTFAEPPLLDPTSRDFQIAERIVGQPYPSMAQALASFDGDGHVGTSDLLILPVNWGPCPPKGDCPADLNGDGSVGVADLLILLANWG